MADSADYSLLTETDRARFWSNVDKSAGCWEWQKSTTRNGYGQFGVHKRGTKRAMFYAHRYVYTSVKGPIPDGMYVLHTCDNRKCCNPEHLRLGTQRENMHDMISKQRGSGRNGHGNNTKITTEQAAAIKRLRRDGLTQIEVAKRVGVTEAIVSNIDRGTCWAWVS